MTKPIKPPVVDEALDMATMRKAVKGAAIAGATFMTAHNPPERSPVSPPVAQTREHLQPMAKEAMYLALTIWAEARNHGTEGMNAVGHVIKNRVEADKNMFGGDTYKGVVTKRKQFSCWNPNDPNYDKIKNISQYLEDVGKQSPDAKRWEEAKKIAFGIVTGRSTDVSKGALFYHTTGVRPNWAAGMKKIGRYANHIFYRPEEKLHRV